eukprot:TRINITY_DN52532_c0_g1_i1.p1 TRINITY_DN52532_c0_g1~~TRINITY_DN52532_c0_g1_i1.p1  ORF type:complete len:198 (+),score=35.04 TRINITY_DN52532_c0_g1_i1:88-594(+)
MEPLVEAVVGELQRSGMPSPLVEGVEERAAGRHSGDVEMELWIAALRRVAPDAANPVPVGLRRCCVCGAALSTPVRMPDHLAGRRHCVAVAELHLGRRLGDNIGGRDAAAAEGCGVVGKTDRCKRAICSRGIVDADATEIFRQQSTQPLSASVVEPPDIALAMASSRG